MTTLLSMREAPLLTQFSPAKINLFLHIIGQGEDGYHQLQTVFRPLNWGDTLRFYSSAAMPNTSDGKLQSAQSCCFEQLVSEAINKGLVRLIGGEHITTNPADNLIIKAAHALLTYCHDHLADIPKLSCLPHVDIHIDKVIPMGAGLGGGSSNAAATLTALNSIWQLRLSDLQLSDIAASLGADVPIFIQNQDAIGEGIGECLTPIDLPHQRFLLLMPKAHISTATLFSHPDLPRNCPEYSIAAITQDQPSYLWSLSSPYHNTFERIVRSLSPKVDQALSYLQHIADQLIQEGGELIAPPSARLTGSGSAVFLPLPNLAYSSGFHQPALPLSDRFKDWVDQAPCPAIIVDSLFGTDKLDSHPSYDQSQN